MNKISITIDVTKVTKEKIAERRFTNAQGHEVIARDLKLDIVQLKEPKVVKTGDNWEMVKTHFVTEQQTKEEKAANKKSNIIGNGFTFRERVATAEDINPDDIPFE